MVLSDYRTKCTAQQEANRAHHSPEAHPPTQNAEVRSIPLCLRLQHQHHASRDKGHGAYYCQKESATQKIPVSLVHGQVVLTVWHPIGHIQLPIS